MNQEKDGSKHSLFYDTYALIEIIKGGKNYEVYTKNVKIITTILNLYEMYYILLQENLFSEAEKFFERLLPFCIRIKPELFKEAARFRLSNSKLKLSYIDVLGYTIANDCKINFLTGDSGFEKLPNVKFVK